jgi:hypothetical protein
MERGEAASCQTVETARQPCIGRTHMGELNIDAKHNQAIRREIGERLHGLLRKQPEVPARLRELVRQVLPRQDFFTRLNARIVRLRAGLDRRNRM